MESIYSEVIRQGPSEGVQHLLAHSPGYLRVGRLDDEQVLLGYLVPGTFRVAKCPVGPHLEGTMRGPTQQADYLGLGCLAHDETLSHQYVLVDDAGGLVGQAEQSVAADRLKPAGLDILPRLKAWDS